MEPENKKVEENGPRVESTLESTESEEKMLEEDQLNGFGTGNSEAKEEAAAQTTGKTKEEKIALASQVEAALFLAGRPIGEMELAEALGSDRITIRWALRWIKRKLIEQNSALEILNLTKDRWVLQLCEEFSKALYDYIEEFIPKEEMITREEVDILTEIAYRQPISTTMLLKILGRPDVYNHIRGLSEKGFINLKKQEKANILTTTKKFADIYGFDTEMRNLKIQLFWRLKKRAKF
ncbi:MAG: SMC-Scp complex subunit ScpB [Candidatus Helarchaeota archaeon]